MAAHLDTDFLVYALSAAGPERRRLLEYALAKHPAYVGDW